jgi:hypothetical protein
MKSKLLTVAGALALMAVLGKFYAVPAIAQAVRAALVQDRDNPARQPFSAIVPGVNGISSTPAVAAGTRLIVNNIYFNLQAGTGLSCGVEVNAPGHHSFYNLDPRPASLSISGEMYSAAQSFQIALDPGQIIQASLTCAGPDTGSGGSSPKISSTEVSFTGYSIGIP